MDSYIMQCADSFSEFYTRREEDRWSLADICALLEYKEQGLERLREGLQNNFGISITLQTLKNYARVAASFSEDHRHTQYKWSGYLEWSLWDDPIEAMEMALDNGLSPSSMRRLRLGREPEKQSKCSICGGRLESCQHGQTNSKESPLDTQTR